MRRFDKIWKNKMLWRTMMTSVKFNRSCWTKEASKYHEDNMIEFIFLLSKKMKFFTYFLMLSIVVFAKRDRSWYSFHTGFLLPGLFSLIATKSYDILNSWIFQIDLFTANHLTFNETWSTIKDKLQYFKKSLLPYVDNNW